MTIIIEGAGDHQLNIASDENYSWSLDGAVINLTHEPTGSVTQFVNYETINFGGTESVIQYDNEIKALVSMYDDVFERPGEHQADLGGVQYYYHEVTNPNKDVSLGDVALHFVYSNEYETFKAKAGVENFEFGNLSTEDQIIELYDALFNEAIDQGDLNYWLGQANSGTSMNDIADAFIASNEYIGTYLPVNQWDFSA